MMNADKLIHNFNRVIFNPIIVLLFAVALLVFLWGVFQYVKGADSEDARSTGALHIWWGLIGMVIMVSAFGILNAILGTFGISNPAVHQIIP